MTRYMVVIERGDSSWGTHVPDLPGCIAVGESRAEAVKLIREAVALQIEALKRDGPPIPRSSCDWGFVDQGLA